MALVVAYEHRVDLVAVHDAFYLRYLGVCGNDLWVACHDVGNGAVEELSLPALHGASDVAVGDQPDDTALLVERHTHAELAFRHVDDGLSQVHVLRNDRQIVGAHYVLGRGKQTLAQFAARMELCEVAWTEVAHLHQRNCQGVAHGQGGSGRRCGGQVERARLVVDKHLDVDR